MPEPLEKLTMSYLRGNFRRKATDLAYDGMAGGIANWIQGSNIMGNDREFGGFLIASFASLVPVGGTLQVSMFDLFSSTYGATLASNLLLGGSGGSSPQTGMKPIILNFMDFSGDGTSAIVFYHLSTTQAMSTDDSVLMVIINKMSGNGASAITALSAQSVHFVMQGWIVSTPFAYK